jgi:hypothetical protein
LFSMFIVFLLHSVLFFRNHCFWALN